jgi:hypothetical protein
MGTLATVLTATATRTSRATARMVETTASAKMVVLTTG